MEEHLIEMWEKFISYQYNFLNEASILVSTKNNNKKKISTLAKHFLFMLQQFNLTSVIHLHLHNTKVLWRFLLKVPGKFLIFRTSVCLLLDK